MKMKATYILDTSKMLTRELKIELEKIFVKGESFCNLYITVMSFGFKYGIPQDADLVFDVRFLPNPYYIDTLKEKQEMIRKSRIMSCRMIRDRFSLKN